MSTKGNFNKTELLKFKSLISSEDKVFLRIYYGEAKPGKYYNDFVKYAPAEINKLLESKSPAKEDQSRLRSLYQAMVDNSPKSKISKKNNDSIAKTDKTYYSRLYAETRYFANSYFKYDSPKSGAHDAAFTYHKDDAHLFEEFTAYRTILNARLKGKTLTEKEVKKISTLKIDPNMSLSEAGNKVEKTYNAIANKDYVKGKTTTDAVKAKGRKRLLTAITIGAGVVTGTLFTLFSQGGAMPTDGASFSSVASNVLLNGTILGTFVGSAVAGLTAPLINRINFGRNRNEISNKLRKLKNVEARNLYIELSKQITKGKSKDMNASIKRFNNTIERLTFAELYRKTYGKEASPELIESLTKENVLTEDGKFTPDFKLSGRKSSKRLQAKTLIEAEESLKRENTFDRKFNRLKAKREKSPDPKLQSTILDNNSIYNDVVSQFDKLDKLSRGETQKSKKKSVEATQTTTQSRFPTNDLQPAYAESKDERITKEAEVLKAAMANEEILSTQRQYRNLNGKFVISISKTGYKLGTNDFAKIISRIDEETKYITKEGTTLQFTDENNEKMTVTISQDGGKKKFGKRQ